MRRPLVFSWLFLTVFLLYFCNTATLSSAPAPGKERVSMENVQHRKKAFWTPAGKQHSKQVESKIQHVPRKNEGRPGSRVVKNVDVNGKKIHTPVKVVQSENLKNKRQKHLHRKEKKALESQNGIVQLICNLLRIFGLQDLFIFKDICMLTSSTTTIIPVTTKPSAMTTTAAVTTTASVMTTEVVTRETTPVPMCQTLMQRRKSSQAKRRK